MRGIVAGPVEVEARLSQGVLKAGERGRHYLQLAVTGLEDEQAAGRREPMNVVLVIDTSGSMAGEKLEGARQGALAALGHLQENDILGIVAYSGEARVLLPATRVGDGSQARAALAELRSDGGTALFAGISAGAVELRKFAQGTGIDRMVLLSDGLANVGPSSPAALEQLGQALGREGTSVTTLGFGLDYNAPLLARLAAASDGLHAFVENSDALGPVLETEFAGLQRLCARELRLELELGAGVRVLRSLGHEALIEGNHAEVELKQLAAGQTRYLLLEVELATPRLPASGEGSMPWNLGMATVSWRGMEAQPGQQQAAEFRSLQRVCAVLVSDDARAVAGSGDARVLAAVTEILASERDREAAELIQRGQNEQAQQLLAGNAAFVGRMAAQLHDERLLQYAQRLEWDVSNFEGNGRNIGNDIESRANAAQYQNRSLDEAQLPLQQLRNLAEPATARPVSAVTR